jgi:hypothetical protein
MILAKVFALKIRGIVIWMRIPVQRDHSFQANAATHSVLKQPLIPVNAATLW